MHYSVVAQLDGAPPVDEWALITEVPLRAPTGAAAGRGSWGSNQRRIDVLLIRAWGGGRRGHERLAFEIKVSRSDYRNETDEKRAPAEISAHRCAYAAPAGLIDPATLPDGWGLIEADDGPQLRWRRPAARREPSCDLDYLLAAVARRASRAEERIRTGGDGDPAQLARLIEEHARLTARVERAEQRVRQADNQRRTAVAMLLAATPQTCATCGQPLRPLVRRQNLRGADRWQHTGREQEATCHRLRQEARRARLAAETGSYYARGLPDPVMTVAEVEAEAADIDADAG